MLWGAALSAVGARLGDDADEITGVQLAGAIRAGLDAITALGKAKVGDKTMLGLVPFVGTLDEQTAAGVSLTQAWTTAADVAEQASQATAPTSVRGLAGPARSPIVASAPPTREPFSLALCVRIAGAVIADG